MALITCSECGKEISDKAAACIHCGCPTQQPQQKPSIQQSDVGYSEHRVSLSKFWKKRIGRFQVYEDRIVFSKLKVIYIFPIEIEEFNVLISDIISATVITPIIPKRLIVGILEILFGLLLICTLTPVLIAGIALLPHGIFNIVEAYNPEFLVRAKTGMRTIYINKRDAQELGKFIEDINNVRARDFNYVRRGEYNPNTVIVP